MFELALAKRISIFLVKANLGFILNPLAEANGNEYGILCNLSYTPKDLFFSLPKTFISLQFKF
jgi:hypothetical protein